MGKKNTALDYVNSFKALPNKGLEVFVDFVKRSQIMAQELIGKFVMKRKVSEQEIKQAAEYAIAKEFIEMYQRRYGKRFIKEVIDWGKSDKLRAFVHDHVNIETLKILSTENQEEIMKRRHRADGIMIVPKLAEKLETYKLTVSDYELRNPDVLKSINNEDEDEEIKIGKQDVEQ